ncbi:MAG: endo-1,4-beta-xylanase, partial [Bacteroidales bacterium]|nr:endo-1,4-beta-xylanase [Bacteroidales bacterium]
EAQRGGITFWGVSDKRSWLGAAQQPLLYNNLYRRKEAYYKLHSYLLERSGLDNQQ